jgi:nucleotide-binding universal stress UspA family protein
MTTHGRGGFSRLWLGSVADQLVRRIDAPVLLLRHGARREDADFRSITVALDGSPGAEQVLAHAIALGPRGYYTLVRVVEPPPPPMVTPVGLYPPDSPTQSLDELSAAAANYLEEVAKRMRDRSLSVETCVRVGGVAEQVLGLAAQSHSRLIVVGTRGARGLDRLLLGSVADKIVRGAVQPVLVVPAGSPRSGSRVRTEPLATAASSQTDNQVSMT